VANSELQHRLEHLVSYSSQLIFVSGDSIAQQQKSLQAFLSQQSENTEIAFVNGEADATKQSYRKQIKEQLLGEGPGLFNRPLNELLAPLNHHEGPVLICICQAEKIPADLLQELWDLVLQSRFASNKQHLNIILFAQSDWAEEAKTWLPSKNRDKPVLLSTESVISDSLQTNSLDALIAQKRKQFEQHKIARSSPEPKPQTLLTVIWFKIIIAVAFLLVFSGLMLWLYPIELTDLFSSTKPSVSSQREISNEESTAILDTKPIQTDLSQPQNLTDSTDELGVKSDDAETNGLVMAWQNDASEPKPATNNLIVTETKQQTDNSNLSNPELPASEIGGSQSEAQDYQIEDPVIDPQVIEQVEAKPLSDLDAQTLLNLQANEYVLQIAGLSDQLTLRQFVDENNLNDKVWIYQTQRFGGNWYVLLNRQSYLSLEDARQDIPNLPVAMQRSTPFVKTVSQVQQELSTQ
jgi:DamX protein